MRFALINSGLGLLAAASELHKLIPAADIVIAMDPDGMPWGPRTPYDIAQRSLAIARAAAAYEPDVIVMACNTGSVHALEALRAEFEPDIPVVGTVPAIKPAAAVARSVAIWATVATTSSEYQRKLIADFGGSASVTAVACPGLATAIDAGDQEATMSAIAEAAKHTPRGCGAVVLGCTEYELAADQIGLAVAGAAMFGSATAVAAQAVRRAVLAHHVRTGVISAASGASLAGMNGAGTNGDGSGGTGSCGAGANVDAANGGGESGTVRVMLSGRAAALPAAALLYPQGRELAALVVSGDQPRDVMTEPAALMAREGPAADFAS